MTERLHQPHDFLHNGDAERYWVKFHFETDQGIECLTEDEAIDLVLEDQISDADLVADLVE